MLYTQNFQCIAPSLCKNRLVGFFAHIIDRHFERNSSHSHLIVCNRFLPWHCYHIPLDAFKAYASDLLVILKEMDVEWCICTMFLLSTLFLHSLPFLNMQKPVILAFTSWIITSISAMPVMSNSFSTMRISNSFWLLWSLIRLAYKQLKNVLFFFVFFCHISSFYLWGCRFKFHKMITKLAVNELA